MSDLEMKYKNRNMLNVPSQLHPWNHFVSLLSKHLTNEDIEMILPHYQKTCDITDTDESPLKIFYDTVDNDDNKVQAACHLQKVLQEVQLHTDDGDSLSDMLECVIEKIIKYNQELEVQPNEMFIGRDDEIKLLMDIFEKNKKCKGVCICGIGGQGKSSLARNVCLKLKQRWNIIKPDLRNKSSISDILKAILSSAKLYYPMIDEQKELQIIFEQFLIGSKDMKLITRDTIFILDDCEIFAQNDFTTFVEDMLTTADMRKDDIKVRFLFISRSKFAVNPEIHSTSDSYQVKMNGRLAEVELSALDQTSAVVLLSKSSMKDDIDPKVAADIARECAYSPLAITMVAQLIKGDSAKFTPYTLLFYLKNNKKNVTKQMKIDTCIMQVIENLTAELQKALVSLAVFQSSAFTMLSAKKILQENSDLHKSNIMQMLHNLHLVDVEPLSSNNPDKKQYSLHPLVYRFITEWKKRPDLEAVYNEALKEFFKCYENIICDIMKTMETKYWRGSRELEMHKVHIIQFYNLHENDQLSRTFPKCSSNKEILNKKRISDLSRLLLSLVKRRRIFQLEAERSLKAGNDSMYIFWMVEKAEVFLLYHDRVEIAMEILDALTNGRFAALRGLHSEPFYKPMVHALYHKMKGLCRWKQYHLTDACDHLELALLFFGRCERFSPATRSALEAKVHQCLGQVCMDMGKLDKAEEFFMKGLKMVKDNTKCQKKNEDLDFAKEQQWDVPMYFYHLADIKFRRAKAEADISKTKNKYLEDALEFLNRGMELDVMLKLNLRNEFYTKMKLQADIFIQQGNLEKALQYADEVLDKRRAILQPPHTCYTESVYQVGQIYMLIGNDLKRKGDTDKAIRYWQCSFDYFDELMKHHLREGGISRNNPVYQDIKKDHLQVTQLVGCEMDLKKVKLFYKDLDAGAYDSEKEYSINQVKAMQYTRDEVMAQLFGGGGQLDESGNTKDDTDVLECEDIMPVLVKIDSKPGGGTRKDSGQGHSSSDFSESISSESGSMSAQLARMKLEQSLSLEDNVFEESTRDTKEKPAKKRQKTIDETSD